MSSSFGTHYYVSSGFLSSANAQLLTPTTTLEEEENEEEQIRTQNRNNSSLLLERHGMTRGVRSRMTDTTSNKFNSNDNNHNISSSSSSSLYAFNRTVDLLPDSFLGYETRRRREREAVNDFLYETARKIPAPLLPDAGFRLGLVSHLLSLETLTRHGDGGSRPSCANSTAAHPSTCAAAPKEEDYTIETAPMRSNSNSNSSNKATSTVFSTGRRLFDCGWQSLLLFGPRVLVPSTPCGYTSAWDAELLSTWSAARRDGMSLFLGVEAATRSLLPWEDAGVRPRGARNTTHTYYGSLPTPAGPQRGWWDGAPQLFFSMHEMFGDTAGSRSTSRRRVTTEPPLEAMAQCFYAGVVSSLWVGRLGELTMCFETSGRGGGEEEEEAAVVAFTARELIRLEALTRLLRHAGAPLSKLHLWGCADLPPPSAEAQQRRLAQLRLERGRDVRLPPRPSVPSLTARVAAALHEFFARPWRSSACTSLTLTHCDVEAVLWRHATTPQAATGLPLLRANQRGDGDRDAAEGPAERRQRNGHDPTDFMSVLQPTRLLHELLLLSCRVEWGVLAAIVEQQRGLRRLVLEFPIDARGSSRSYGRLGEAVGAHDSLLCVEFQGCDVVRDSLIDFLTGFYAGRQRRQSQNDIYSMVSTKDHYRETASASPPLRLRISMEKSGDEWIKEVLMSKNIEPYSIVYEKG